MKRDFPCLTDTVGERISWFPLQWGYSTLTRGAGLVRLPFDMI